jgi:hypothetical protein
MARTSRTRPGRRPLILVFGESRNDVDSIAELVRAMNPSFDVAVRMRPPSLTRDAGARSVRTWSTTLEQLITVGRSQGLDIRAVVVHRDADGPDAEGAQEALLARQLASLRRAPVVPVPAVPVETIEAWWFLFPDAVESVNPVAWKGVMPRHRRDVETISKPKVELMRLTRRGPGRLEYSEGDSLAIARRIVSSRAEPVGRASSYQRFRAAVAGL